MNNYFNLNLSITANQLIHYQKLLYVNLYI